MSRRFLGVKKSWCEKQKWDSHASFQVPKSDPQIHGHQQDPKQLQFPQAKTHLNFPLKNKPPHEKIEHVTEQDNEFPTMSDIMEASKDQKVHLRFNRWDPFSESPRKAWRERERELGMAEGMIRVWLGGKILHLDSIKLRREILGLERSIFGIGLFIGAVAIRYGYECLCGCGKADLLAINDTDLYYSKGFSSLF